MTDTREGELKLAVTDIESMPRKSRGERANSHGEEQACKDQQAQRGEPTYKMKSKLTGTDTKKSKHAGRKEEKHRNRLEKGAKTGEPKEKSRRIRQAGVWEQTSSERRAPTQGGGGGEQRQALEEGEQTS